MRDERTMDFLAARGIPLEICPTSNLRTNALDIQLNSAHSRLVNHPLVKLLRHGIPVTLSTDDPAMFKATLLDEYCNALDMGLTRAELLLLNATLSITPSSPTPRVTPFLYGSTPSAPNIFAPASSRSDCFQSPRSVCSSPVNIARTIPLRIRC
jgi:aminodeoxyfutalosine deaminase